MSLVGKLALFALKEVARPLLASVGQAVGDRIGRHVDPVGAELRAAMVASQLGMDVEEEEDDEDEQDGSRSAELYGNTRLPK